MASIYHGRNQERRDLSAEHAAEEKRVQETVRDRVWLLFNHFHDNVMERFGPRNRNLSPADFDLLLNQAFSEEIARVLPPDMLPPQQDLPEVKGHQRYRIVFTHECLARSCDDASCVLCQNNPQRPCGEVIFKKKYFENDVITAKCRGTIKIQLRDLQTDEVAKIATPVELFILNGFAHEQKFASGIAHCACDDIEACSLWMVEKEGEEKTPLLRSELKQNEPNGKVLIRLQDGQAILPNVKVTKSSEALLGKRRTIFRLYAGVPTDSSLPQESVIPAVDSRGFVVATQRAKLQDKKERPFLDDPIASLEQIGGRRVETLGCLYQKNLELPAGAPRRVQTVRDFIDLGNAIQGHPQQKKELMTLLKMNDVQWIEAWEHAETAVQADNKLRVWWHNLTEGLVYECETGEVKLHYPAGFIRVGQTPWPLSSEELLQDQQDFINRLHKEALASYDKPGHPGWEVYHFDSSDFKANPRAMLVEGPKNSYQQLAKVEAGGDISEYEDLMSGISGGMSNLTLDESWRSLDDARFGSHFVNSYVKDDDSMPSVVNDDGQGGATTAQQLGGQSGNLLICPPVEQVDVAPPPRIPLSPPHTPFTRPTPPSPQQQALMYTGQGEFGNQQVQNAEQVRICPPRDPPIVLAGQMPVKVAPREVVHSPNCQFSPGVFQMNQEPGAGPHPVSVPPNAATSSAHCAFPPGYIGQPFQDVGVPINSEDLGSWRVPSEPDYEIAKSMLRIRRADEQ